MMEISEARELLNNIPCSQLDYQDWVNVGMALHHEGFPCSLWDEWSSTDKKRYHIGECSKRWGSFGEKDNVVTMGTVVHMAKSFGWSPALSMKTCEWDDLITTDNENDSRWNNSGSKHDLPFVQDDYSPISDITKYLSALFMPEDHACIVTTASKDKDEKWKPYGGSDSRTCQQLINTLAKNKESSITDTFGTINNDSGAWVCFNPTNGNGRKDSNITTFRYALVESDSITIDEQWEKIHDLRLPVAVVVNSGGKSLHAIVHIDAKDAREYSERVQILYDYCEKHDYPVDHANKNPARLSRLPGVKRGDKWQYIVGQNIGPGSWGEFERIINQPEAWEHIVKDNVLPLFPLELLPGWIKSYIDNFTDNTGVSKDFCAACVLGAVSTVVAGHLQIHFNTTLYEPAALYIAFVGRPGTMKTTAINQFAGPARAWLMEQNIAVKKYNRGVSGEIDVLEGELSNALKTKDENRISDLKSQIEQKQTKRKKLYPVPYTDVTPEAVIDDMVNTNGIHTILTDEGNIINILTGNSSYNARGTVPNFDIFLQAYDGKPYHGRRKTSGEIDLDRTGMSILIGMQPILLESFCRSQNDSERGLVQRFNIFTPEESTKQIDHTKPNSIDLSLVQQWNEHIREIASHFMKPDDEPITMELFKDADNVIREIWNYEDILKAERGPADDAGITGWISKMHGKALRLAAILAVLDEPKTQNISKTYAEKAAILLKEYFLPHYIHAFENADVLTKEQKQIVNWIIRHAERTGDHERFSERDLQQDIRQRTAFSGKKGKEKFQTAMDQLYEKHYIRPEKNITNNGKPSKIWQINPELFIK